ncbi:MAG: aminotransferase class V-fold PLP-dependent enzyme [Candidatus Hydrogenedentes bacterium]|nr:aminotransferase class V-fold PLP-dependent enzyme [Candidatus Hydrogenedentota bacterium]
MGYFGEGQDVTFDGPVFPTRGGTVEGVLAALDEVYGMDADPVRGHVMFYATTLMEGHPATEVCRRAYAKYMKKNMLVREIAPGLQRLEQEVKRMAIELLGLPDGTRVNMTSGGSESLYCGINAAYQWAKDVKPEITQPEIVIPYSAHAAFSKWCHYTGIKIKRVPLGPGYRANVEAMEEAITPNTIMLAGSAPCWPYGLYDPIESIAALAEKRGLWMHVDACIGGYQAAFVEKLGVKLPNWRIGQIPGVCSMSADLHKHAYAAKPLSTIFFKNKELQKYHWFHPADWPSGPYATEALMGSFPASSVASAWAVMKYLGEEGYIELAKATLEARKRYVEGINSVDGMRCWDTDLCVLLFETGALDTLAVMAGLFERQSFVFPIYQPMLIQVAVDPVSVEVTDTFVRTLREVAQGVREGKITSEPLMKLM